MCPQDLRLSPPGSPDPTQQRPAPVLVTCAPRAQQEGRGEGAALANAERQEATWHAQGPARSRGSRAKGVWGCHSEGTEPWLEMGLPGEMLLRSQSQR